MQSVGDIVRRLITSGALLIVWGAVPPAAHGDESPNESFATATLLNYGQLVLDNRLDGGINRPDTLIGVFSSADFIGDPMTVNDNGSLVGDGFASGIYSWPVPDSETINFLVSGAGDIGFFGEHGEAGKFDIVFQVADRAGVQIAQLESKDVDLFPQGVIPFRVPVDPTWIGGTYDVFIDNSVTPGGTDLRDFFRFRGLPPGARYTATISQTTVDTVLGQFDNLDGTLVASDDDSGDGLASQLSGQIPADGDLTLAVTGFNDQSFDIDHTQSGQYRLTIDLPGLNLTDADLNDDSQINSSDADLLVSEIVSGRNHRFFDRNDDGRVNQSDMMAWLDDAIPGPRAFSFGDANLDGTVDGSDFNQWMLNQSQTGVGWSGGDFSADGRTNDEDLQYWLEHRFTASSGSAGPASVPEPTTGVWLLLFGIAASILCHRRR